MVFQVVRVSGTIKKAEEEAIRRARLCIRRAQRASKGGGLLVGEGIDVDDDVQMFGGIEDPDERGGAEEIIDDDDEDDDTD